jgi:TfuA-like protein
VTHGPPETGYLPLSEAMVNIRETLAAAERAGIITGATRAALVGIAKELFYHDRTFERVLERAAERSVPSGEIAALRAWWPKSRVDQKRADALAMLEAMQALLAQAPGPMQVDFVLEWTEVWNDATTAAAAFRQPGGGSAAWLPHDRVLEELRLEAGTYLAVRDRALLRLLAEHEAERPRHMANAGARHETLARLRARHGLFTRADLDRWLEANAIDRRRLERIVDQEVQLEAVRALAAPALRHYLLDELRLRNDFARFAERARSKQASLEQLGFDHPDPDAPYLAPPAVLRAWYFDKRLGQPVPDDIDAAARELGFADRSDFDRAVRREWLYLRRAEGGI